MKVNSVLDEVIEERSLFDRINTGIDHIARVSVRDKRFHSSDINVRLTVPPFKFSKRSRNRISFMTDLGDTYDVQFTEVGELDLQTYENITDMSFLGDKYYAVRVAQTSGSAETLNAAEDDRTVNDQRVYSTLADIFLFISKMDSLDGMFVHYEADVRKQYRAVLSKTVRKFKKFKEVRVGSDMIGVLEKK